jgi:predicted DNA-binding protein (UPF0251 family)
MHPALSALYQEYQDSLTTLRKGKARAKREGRAHDLSKLTSMERETLWSMQWMTSGWMPEYSTGPYRRAFPIDPQMPIIIYGKYLRPSPTTADATKRIEKMVARLSRRENEAIMMVCAEGLSYDEAAKLMGVGRRSTVQCYVARAKAKILAAG